jgi:hypothetical protein
MQLCVEVVCDDAGWFVRLPCELVEKASRRDATKKMLEPAGGREISTPYAWWRGETQRKGMSSRRVLGPGAGGGGLCACVSSLPGGSGVAHGVKTELLRVKNLVIH